MLFRNFLENILDAILNAINSVEITTETLTASGSVASFETNAPLPLKSHVVDIVVSQSGSGDPSPFNPRPIISGYSDINIGNAGVNYLPITAQSTTQSGVTYTVSENGIALTNNATAMNDLLVSSNLIIPNGQFYLTGTPSDGGVNKYRMWVREVSKTSSATNYYNDDGNGVLFTVDNSAFTYEVSIRVWSGYGDELTFKPMISNSITDFVPYAGQNITIPIGSNVYGGTYDAKTGKLPYPYKKRVLNGSESWYTSGSGAYIEITDAHIVNNYADCISNQYTSSTWTAVTSNTQTNYVMCIYKNNSWPKARLAFNLLGESLADFKLRIANDNIEVAYPEDVTLQLAPCAIETVPGVDNIFANTGNTSLEYYKIRLHGGNA